MYRHTFSFYFLRFVSPVPKRKITKKDQQATTVLKDLLTFDHMKEACSYLKRALYFYVEGFRSMTWGRTLWVIILIKLFIMFAILRVFFFQPSLAGKTECEKQTTVAEHLYTIE